MSSYAPPSQPPPPLERVSSSSSSNHANYAPTNVPTPGQALLRNGKMLVYPHGWRGCPKCNDTGYKQGDPSNPCRKCWQDHGKAFNPLLISSSGLQGAKVLQRPLPIHSNAMPGEFPASYASTHGRGHAGYPGASSSGSPTQAVQQHFTGGSSSSFAPPSHPPPAADVAPATPQRRQPVSRTDESREDDLNENGEAPPAYEDAIAAGPDGALPPQRASQAPAATQQHPSFSPPAHAPMLYGPQQHQHQHQHHPLSYPQQQPYIVPMHGPPAMATVSGPQYLPYGRMPPANALVVRPGDPRIGGRLCYKCGGDGIREDFWFGARETCRLCGGTGRIM